MKFVVELIQTFTDQKKHAIIFADSESFERALTQKRESICSALDAKTLVEDEQKIQANKMFIELIHLGAIKANITFKLEKKAVEIDIFDPPKRPWPRPWTKPLAPSRWVCLMGLVKMPVTPEKSSVTPPLTPW